MNVVELKSVTKDYGNGKGIFDIDLCIEQGEMFGYAGTNGAGKTTTLRTVMGFIRPDKGEVKVNGIDPWGNPDKIMKDIGYIPGEIAFPDLRSGDDIIKSQAEFLGVKDLSKANELIKRLQLDVRGDPRRFSKGMKQKLSIVLALMHDPGILLLDEPTTGLDPLMRDSFMEIIKEEHDKGKTIIISSNMFEELEEYCDRVGLIVNGKILDIADVNGIRNYEYRLYKVEFENEDSYRRFLADTDHEIIRKQEAFHQLTFRVKVSEVNDMINELSKYELKYIREIKYDLNSYFEETLGLYEMN